jgi:hypothetical protein
MSVVCVLDVLPEDILHMILEESDMTLTMIMVSKESRKLAGNCNDPLSVRQNYPFMYNSQMTPMEHMKHILCDVTRLLRDYKFQIEGVHRSWSYSLYVCKHHDDCGHRGKSDTCSTSWISGSSSERVLTSSVYRLVMLQASLQRTSPGNHRFLLHIGCAVIVRCRRLTGSTGSHQEPPEVCARAVYDEHRIHYRRFLRVDSEFVLFIQNH